MKTLLPLLRTEEALLKTNAPLMRTEEAFSLTERPFPLKEGTGLNSGALALNLALG